ncbi:MAG: C4-dicarboxylate ABC transporter permease [Gracilibacteraceae bacterium]|nr:C4-dicarboxylate ABC transporter permease [Gracilibacteraceae bacterium]
MVEFSGMLLPIVHPELALLVAVGVFAGIYVGAIPGLSVTMAVSLLISFTFSWDTWPAIALMVGIFSGGVYGGSRSAILLNIPGAPAAIATTFDGYPLSLKGEAGKAIGITVVESVIGGILGCIALAVAAPMVAKIALSFSPIDYFLLGAMGLLLVGSLGVDSTYKGIFCGALGVFIGCIGIDGISGMQRFTYGSNALMSGLNYITAMIGLFGISEALIQLKYLDANIVKQKVDKIIPSWGSVLKYMPLTLRTSLIGIIIGALPGTGGDIAALISYDHAKRTVRNPEVPFGEGAVEGLVAPESANNAAIGGSFIPMLTLGIPGDAVTAVFIGALYIHGLKPGPMLMIESPDMFGLIVGSLFISNIFLLIFGMTGIKIFTRVVEVKKSILLPIIMILSIIGSYTINNSMADIFWTIGFGILGYFLKIYGYPIGPVVLGIILSPLLELNLRRALMSAESSIILLFRDIFTQPISIVLIMFIILSILSQNKNVKRLLNKFM